MSAAQNNAYRHWLTVACEAAEAAAALARPRWRERHTVRSKGYRDIVTETDVAMESVIITRLRDAFPQHAITSEEAGTLNTGGGVRWLIDPLDGTTNFSRDNPNYSISIAAVEDGEPVVAVVLAPLTGQHFTAIRGGGAYLNARPIHVSETTRLDEAIFAVDSPREPALRQQMWEHIGVMLQHARTMRALGSAALNIAYVAAGWVDLYFHLSLEPWDQAAAALLVHEAGGARATVSGAPWTLQARDPLMAASAALIAAYHEAMREAPR